MLRGVSKFIVLWRMIWSNEHNQCSTLKGYAVFSSFMFIPPQYRYFPQQSCLQHPQSLVFL
jgi:hypothetical protein